MKKVQLSLIIPVYNGEDYITHILHDLSKQSLSSVEFLIIDDGSTDNTASIIKKFISEIGDNRFKYFYQKNSGVSAARNFGISQSIGEYIMFIDGDDSIEPDLCEIYVKQIKKNKTDIEFFPFQRVERNGELLITKKKQLDYGRYSSKKIVNSENILKLIFNFRIQGYPFGYISKASLWHENSFDIKVHIAEDLLALIQILLKDKNLNIHINKYGKYKYVVRDSSVLNSKVSKETNQEVVELLKNIIELVKKNGYDERSASNLLYGYLVSSIKQEKIDKDIDYYREVRRYLWSNFYKVKMPIFSRMKRTVTLLLLVSPNYNVYQIMSDLKNKIDN